MSHRCDYCINNELNYYLNDDGEWVIACVGCEFAEMKDDDTYEKL